MLSGPASRELDDNASSKESVKSAARFPESSEKYREETPLMLDDARIQILLLENEMLKESLLMAEETAKTLSLEGNDLKRDLFRMSLAYRNKCQEAKGLQEQLLKTQRTIGSVGGDVHMLQQDFGRLQRAYTAKVQDNKRLGGTIDALVNQQQELREELQTEKSSLRSY